MPLLSSVATCLCWPSCFHLGHWQSRSQVAQRLRGLSLGAQPPVCGFEVSLEHFNWSLFLINPMFSWVLTIVSFGKCLSHIHDSGHRGTHQIYLTNRNAVCLARLRSVACGKQGGILMQSWNGNAVAQRGWDPSVKSDGLIVGLSALSLQFCQYGESIGLPTKVANASSRLFLYLPGCGLPWSNSGFGYHIGHWSWHWFFAV